MRTPLIVAAFVAVAAVAVSRWARGYRDEQQAANANRVIGDLSEGTGNVHYIIQTSGDTWTSTGHVTYTTPDYDGPDEAA